MPECYLFPRLPAPAARARLVEVRGRAVPDLAAMASIRDIRAIFGATGGTRLPDRKLELIRDQMLHLAAGFGFPESGNRDGSVAFDHAAATVLAEALPIAAGEASRDDVWAFLTLVLLPDVATWRFPEQQEGRLLGGSRNVFQRVWWRARMLRDPSRDRDPYWLLKLPEDALVGLMERPALSSNPRVALEIGRAVASLAEATPSAYREGAWRAAYKRIRQRIVLTNLEFLEDKDLKTVMEDATDVRALLPEIAAE